MVRLASLTAVFAFCLGLIPLHLPAQTDCAYPATRARLAVRDAGSVPDTLWFGFAPSGTCGADTQLCEYESPPCSTPGVFCVQWEACTPGTWWTLGHHDYRGYVHPAHTDTHRVRFQEGPGGYPFTFTWSPWAVAALADSTVLQDIFGGILHRVRMDEACSLTVSNPALSSLHLIRYGQRLCREPFLKTWLGLRDGASDRDTIWFGHDYTATCGRDSHICGESTEPPPPPPGGVLSLRWTCTPGCCPVHPRHDYLPMGLMGTVDSHRVEIRPGSGGHPLTLSWSPQEVRGLADSALLLDMFGGFLVRVRMDLQGEVTIVNPVLESFLLLEFHSPCGVPHAAAAPSCLLHPNYPNPANPSTTIPFELSERGRIRLEILDILGRRVLTLLDGVYEPGLHRAELDARAFASGAYIYRLWTQEHSLSRTMLVLR
ncbi:MAG: T9SS type A sorting domain-containing protein [Bacteroidota bacterium]